MTNDERQNIIDFMIQRQEIFSANLERTQTQVDGLARAPGQVIEVQARVQNDISHLVKSVPTLVERERNGRNSQHADQNGDTSA
ncbi:MAG TPA: hypothetical protein VF525_16890 [Pyrinomonadaceae bacterium]|jgi:hypothetical protein